MRLAVCGFLIAFGCDRGAPRSEAPAAAPESLHPVAADRPAAAPAGAAAPAPGAPACSVPALPVRRPAPARLVAIGDLHGDLGAARSALRAAGAIDDRDRWIGGGLVVVQTGDVLDRGDDDRALLDLFARLETEAARAGGAVIALLGNHELMNGAGDFRYVTPAGRRAFDPPGTEADAAGGPAGSAAVAPAASAGSSGDPDRGRRAALGPGGRYARWLAHHAVIAIIGDTVLSHAGVLGDWTGRIDEVNQTARCWLDGQSRALPIALTADDSPVWTRAAGAPRVDCAALGAALDALGARRMVVGHTVQDRGITQACDGALWRIDVGLARFYGGPIEVLELVPGAPPRVVIGTRG
jgi:hypothetical protein